jgi:hypothetical protein
MSLLAPLYVLGLGAVIAPFIFHLIRRAPRGEVPFSSLMFLSATPPRLTRRSRLDHWLLLLLRVGALAILAFAFARPFSRQAAQLGSGDGEERRVALLLDTSASMRRGDLWARAQALAREVLADCRPTDQVAVFAFDAAWRPLLGFRESATLDPARRQAIAQALVDRLTPGWAGTNLGQALVDTVAAIDDVADTSDKASRMPRRVVLVSDLAQGTRLDALGRFERPADVKLELKTVADTGANAGLEGLADENEAQPASPASSHRVRVVNNSDSARDRFNLTWIDEKGTSSGSPIDVYVPAGESRVVRVPRPPARLARPALRLSGDAQGFDNTIYFADVRRSVVNVVYIGQDRGDDHEGHLYYLQRAFIDSPQREVRIVTPKPSEALKYDSSDLPQLVIVTSEAPGNAEVLRDYVNRGGTLVHVITGPGQAGTLAAVAGIAPWSVEEATVGRDVMLGEIAFDHPLFAPLAGAQFNDFTKIRFWKYRRIDDDRLGDSRVLARFENNAAAVIEKRLGKGKLIVLASGWRPADSQLARSSKFVPLLSSLLELRDRRPVVAANERIGARIPLPVSESSNESTIIRKPDGTSVTVAPQGTYFDGADQPGVYTIDTPAGSSSFAVNLDPLESKTTPLNAETIEQFGVRLVNHAPKDLDHEQLRQMHNAELEGRQKVWRWLILAVIGILILETWLAGRAVDRPRSVGVEALTA